MKINHRADWRDELKVGDILVTPSNDFRIVRDVSYCDLPEKSYYGLLTTITFSIRKASWTRRATTTKSRNCIAKWKKLEGVRAKLDSPLDKKLLEDIQSENGYKNGTLNFSWVDASKFI
jgi:hypothetical protein